MLVVGAAVPEMGAIDKERVGLLSGAELRSAGSDALPLSSGRQGLHGVQQWLRRLLWDGSGWASQELFGLWLYIWSTVFSTAMSIAAKIAGILGLIRGAALKCLRPGRPGAD